MENEQVVDSRVAGGEPWILTASGRQFWPLNPRPADVEIADIAHALSNLCRFTGHCRRFYSVAEHSIRVAEHLPVKYQAWGLLHDAAEAYVSDLASPLKRSEALKDYRAVEGRVLLCVLTRFGLHHGGEDIWLPPAVKEADLRMLMTEKRDLMPDGPWDVEGDPYTDVVPDYDMPSAKRRFLEMAAKLGLS
jgi:hypothetical protein